MRTLTTKQFAWICLVSASVAAPAAVAQVTARGVEARMMEKGVECDFRFECATGFISEFDMLRSGVSRFTDNLGGNLGTKPAETFPDYDKMPFFFACATEDANRKFLATISCPNKPRAGATSFQIEGELKLTLAQKQDKGESRSIKIKKDSEISLGTLKGKFTEVSTRGEKKEFTIEMNNPPENLDIKEIEIFDAAGEEIHASKTAQRIGFAGQPQTYKISFYGIKAPQDNITFKYLMWPDARVAMVPFKITVPMKGTAAPAAETVQAQVQAPTKPPAAEPAKPEATRPPPVEKAQPAPGGWPVLKVTGVMGSGKTGMAMINGQMLGAGETISGVTVVSVKKGVVTLKCGNETKSLSSGQSVP